MPDNKTPQTEAQTLELLNASITRETVRGAVENFLGASKEAAKEDLARLNISFESGDLDTVEFWTRAATRACEMLNKRSEQLREVTAERDALKAREELAQTSLRLALSGMKMANEQRERAERALTTILDTANSAAAAVKEMTEDAARYFSNKEFDAQMAAKMRAERDAADREAAAESRRNAAVSDTGPANDVALKVTE